MNISLRRSTRPRTQHRGHDIGVAVREQTPERSDRAPALFSLLASRSLLQFEEMQVPLLVPNDRVR